MKKTIRKSIAIFLITVLLWSCTSMLPIATASDVLHPTGLVKDDWDNLDNVLVSSSLLTLPNSVDNTTDFPLPGDQGTQSSCAAWAVGYALQSGNEIVKRNWSRTNTAHCFSPSYIFNQVNGGKNSGISVSSALDIVVKQGVCSLNYFPYNDTDFKTQPSSLQKASAAMYKAQSWNRVADTYTMKDLISKRQGVIIGITVYSDFDNINSSNQIYDEVSGTSRGSHAICLIGYDDSKNAFKFINSWGTDWGIDGYGWISYDLVNSNVVNIHGAGRGFSLMATVSDNYLLGDIDGDGMVSAIDARRVLQHTSGNNILEDEKFVLADVNGDAQVDAIDSRCIMQYAAELITQFPLYD